MKKILGLDPGIASVGWAVVQTAEEASEKSGILDAGVVKVDFDNFAYQKPDGKISSTGKIDELYRKGVTVSPNLVRRQARQARRRLQHYQQRREQLIKLLTANGFITAATPLNEEGKDTTYQTHALRAKAVTEAVTLEELAKVLLMINKSRGYKSTRKGESEGEDTNYLKTITERSEVLLEKGITVGQYLYEMLQQHPLKGIKNQTFYRKDYEDEFERIWSCQMKFHKELTKKLKKQIRDKVIFFQRPIESKKGDVGFCQLESREVVVNGKTYTTGSRVIPTSSPLYQEFRMWQRLNDVAIKNLMTGEVRHLTQEEKEKLAAELSIRKELTKTSVVRLLYGKAIKSVELNFDSLIGNDTAARIYKACLEVIKLSGHELDTKKMSSAAVIAAVQDIFGMLGYRTVALTDAGEFAKLWHLIYSFPGDSSRSGHDTLTAHIKQLFNFDSADQAEKLANIIFADGYGNLSSKAISKILPKMKEGLQYSDACLAAGYNHSVRSVTKEDNENRVLSATVTPIPHNSLRNPLVERILNKMVYTINALMAKHGQFDEIHIELPRELCSNAEKRAKDTAAIDRNTKEKEKAKQELKEKLAEMGFPVTYVSPNDVLKYRLYKELAGNGYKTLYSDTLIDLKELILGRGFDKEHIIPKALRLDNGFSNLTIEKTDINLKKSKQTALDFVQEEYGDAAAEQYRQRVIDLLEKKAISKAKHDNLLRTAAEIPANPLDRDLNLTRYITKKAVELLEPVTRKVLVTTGAVTVKLREDWQLVDVLKEMVFEKYQELGLTEKFTDKEGKVVERIREDVWTKRNDHRNHAMDAITVAFTTQAMIHYINSLSSQGEGREQLFHMRQKHLHKDDKGNWIFNSPMPIDEMRKVAKQVLENIFVIHPTPKVAPVTRNKGTLVPRGKLHDATFYGRKKKEVISFEKVDKSFTEEKISTVTNPKYRSALLHRLQQYDGDAKLAFTGKNSLEKNPIWLDKFHSAAVPLKVKCMTTKHIYTKRVAVNENLNIEKVLDEGVRAILKARLQSFGGKAKEAFANLEENPIWLNKEKGIAIKSVIVETDLKDLTPLHRKDDGTGKDFVKPNSNDNSEIYVDEQGELHDNVVSFFDAVKENKLPVNENWRYFFSIKRNEYFVMPGKDFNPLEIDLEDSRNRSLVAKHLFVVQKMSSGDYLLRLHNDTSSGTVKELKDITSMRITSLSKFIGCVKVSIDKSGDLNVLQKIVVE